MTSTLFGLEVGSSFGEYRVERLLGGGETGTVLLAEQVGLGRRVALKLLDPELADSEGFRARFLGDCEIAAALDHPSVLPVYEAGDVDGTLFVAMRCVEGSDLRAMLSGALSTQQAAAIVDQVASGLHAAHCNGLVHRDVKPANVRVEAGTNRVFVSDFGVGTSPPRPGVSLDYCAPERIEGKRLDGRADVYSLGCVLFHCLAGRPPFERHSHDTVDRSEQPPSISGLALGLPTSLDRVIATALARDPTDRYTTTVELAEACRTALASQPASTPVVVTIRPAEEPEPPVEEPEPAAAAQPRRPRRRRTTILGVASLLLAGGAAVGALVVSSGGSHERRVQAVPAPPILPLVAAPFRDTLTSVQLALTRAAAAVKQLSSAPALYDHVAHSGGQGIRYRYTPGDWCGGPLPKTDPCWRDVVPGLGAAEGQRLRVYCYVRGANVRGDAWWAKVKVRPDEYVPAAYLQVGRAASITGCL
jgi:Protein kinase domain